jgi:hypothetical protein
MGQFTLSSTESGYVFWLGNNPGFDRRESPDFIKYQGYTAMFPQLPESAGKSEIEVNRIHREAAFAYIKAEPLLWIRRAFDKLWNMWRPVFSGSSMTHRIIGYTVYPLLLGLALAGMVLSRRDFNRTWPLLAFIAIHLLLHGAITGEIRFRIPLWAALIPFSALTISRLIEIKYSGDSRHTRRQHNSDLSSGTIRPSQM